MRLNTFIINPLDASISLQIDNIQCVLLRFWKLGTTDMAGTVFPLGAELPCKDSRYFFLEICSTGREESYLFQW